MRWPISAAILFLSATCWSQSLPFTVSDPNLQEDLEYLSNQINRNKEIINRLDVASETIVAVANTFTGVNSFESSTTFNGGVWMGGSEFRRAVSSTTWVKGGTTTQGSFYLAFATVTLTLSGLYPLEVQLACSGETASSAGVGISILYDGSNSAFGLGSQKGMWLTGNPDARTDFIPLVGTYPIRASEITAGSHTFAITWFGNSGDQLDWPSINAAVTSDCRFTVREVMQ